MAKFQYSRDFFTLQLRLAEKAADLSGRPLPDCIQSFTAFFGCFGLGPKPDWEHPVWKGYMTGLQQAADPLEWTYQTYLALQQNYIPAERYWGCFAYSLHFNDPTVIRLHFNNYDESGSGALSSARKSARIGELAAMFAVIQQEAPQARSVRGESWLYNRHEYRRLFPPEFGASAQAVPLELAAFQYRALWGQLVDSEGQVRPETASAFLDKLAVQTDVQTFHECLPYRILRTECDVSLFYRFYGLPENP